MKIQNSVVFVTGANRGLGLSFTQQLIAHGASKVYAGVRNPTATEIPGVVQIKIDVTDPASVAAAAEQCGDTTLLINNAGTANLVTSTLDPNLVEKARQLFETNYYGVILTTQAFAPILAKNGGGAIINVLSDATWFSIPILSPYSATKSAVWSFTNALRINLRDNHTQVLGLHVGYLDTDLSKGVTLPKSDPSRIAALTLEALENGQEEIMADAQSQTVKKSLSGDHPYYLNPTA
ncbi:SDR family oxidoreductase [Granulicella sp. dw_53]|uniref:SDR family oxidoreductase n=1 Tax=Granulicella sp. dw_53 TaxID=2719792 RepID=UPI001BD346A8|nr:SDR family oxidoreductase [Granulicella sp. dw_53]